MTIEQRIRKINAKRLKITHAYNMVMNKLRNEEQKIMQECEHPTWTYYPDPSGNNDSSYICNICGKDLTWKDRHNVRNNT